MANGDILHADVEGFLVLGRPFPATSNTGMTETEADGICEEINAEVNLVLKRLSFSLPLGVAENILWAKGTKLFGASSLILDGMLAQDVEEGNTRASRYWDRYLARINQLIDSNGDILDPDDIGTTDPVASTSPRLVGDASEEGQKRYLRFPQRASADQFTDERAIRDSGASWRSAVAGH